MDVQSFPAFLSKHFNVANSTFLSLVSNEQLFGIVKRYAAQFTQQSFTVVPKIQSDLNGEDGDFECDEDGGCCEVSDGKDSTRTRAELHLGFGLHQLKFEGHDLFVYYTPHGQPVGTNCGPALYTTITIFNPAGVGKQDLLKKFAEFLFKWDSHKANDCINIYSWQPQQKYWRRLVTRSKRPLSSIFLPETLKNKAVDDVREFLNAKRWYAEHGIPYKRSYMLYGPPGSGKTSFIQALAGAFDRNVCFLQPCDPLMTDNDFKLALLLSPINSLLVLEDIDALFTRDRKKIDDKCPLTFSGFLNALDGIGSPEGQMFMLTTNHPERLDPALVRAGRVDVRLELTHANRQQVEEMFLSFYPNEKKLAAQFAEQILQHQISMAALQNHFIEHRKNPAAKAAKEIDFDTLKFKDPVKEEEEKQKKKEEEEKEKKKKEEEEKTVTPATATATATAAAPALNGHPAMNGHANGSKAAETAPASAPANVKERAADLEREALKEALNLLQKRLADLNKPSV